MHCTHSICVVLAPGCHSTALCAACLRRACAWSVCIHTATLPHYAKRCLTTYARAHTHTRTHTNTHTHKHTHIQHTHKHTTHTITHTHICEVNGPTPQYLQYADINTHVHTYPHTNTRTHEHTHTRAHPVSPVLWSSSTASSARTLRPLRSYHITPYNAIY